MTYIKTKKFYPKPNDDTKNRFKKLFGWKKDATIEGLVFSEDYNVALSMKNITITEGKSKKLFNTPYHEIKYLGKLDEIHNIYREYDFIEYEDLLFRMEYFLHSLFVIETDSKTDIDVWIIKSTVKSDCGLVLGSNNGLIIIYADWGFEGNKIPITMMIRIEKQKKEKMSIPIEIINKWIKELKIHIAFDACRGSPDSL